MELTPDRVVQHLRAGRAGVLALVARADGSAPREAGAAMWVDVDGVWGTIGGGAAEHDAIAEARAMLAGGPEAQSLRFALGPERDQCCGGAMTVAFRRLSPSDAAAVARGDFALWPEGPVFSASPRRDVFVYGAGHVGRAIVAALPRPPYRVVWIDTRPGAFDEAAQPAEETRLTAFPEADAAAAPTGARHLVLTHSHALDLEIVEAALRREDAGFCGLIGSRTKRAVFERRLRARGLGDAALARLTCPIGLPGLRDKRPAVIAASVVAQLLLHDQEDA